MAESHDSDTLSGGIVSDGVDNSKAIVPYGQWKSSISVAELFSHASAPMYPFYHSDRLYWLESLADDGGRAALMSTVEGRKTCLLSAPFNIRSQVHEYGGNCFVKVGNGIVFNNFRDGCLYLQYFDRSDPPIKLTDHSDHSVVCGYADLVFIEQYSVVIAVSETAIPGQQNENFLVAITVDLLSPKPVMPQKILSGCDFYCAPVVSADAVHLAWIEWDHPYMQWDQSRLMCGRIVVSDNALFIEDIDTVLDQPQSAVSQPGFLADHRLVFASDNDDSDFWNFYLYESGQLTRLTYRESEVGEAHWVFGQKRWQCISNDALIAVETTDKGDQLIQVDTSTGEVTVLHHGFAVCQHLSTDNHNVLLVASFSDQPTTILTLSGETDVIETPVAWQDVSVISSGTDMTGCVSHPKPVSYPTRDGEHAHGYFYSPNNSSYKAPIGTKPPLIVLVHGGPTSRATTEFAPLKQYLTSLGFALLDINHRGSTGYGRQYRQRLVGEWGEIDASDIADGVGYVVSQGWVDETEVFIRGGSAGGYAVLRALTRYGELFAGGACYYGIGNLITLCDITHKFEGKYTDRLIGETYQPETAKNPGSRFTQRSPIFEMDRLVSPLILFQGLKDKVVPPEVSREVVDVLEKKGLMYDYVEYPEEGHGFRMTATKVDALTKETAFFASIIQQRV